jgi:uncharacterized membrane protein YkvA (DUF1232 family)
MSFTPDQISRALDAKASRLTGVDIERVAAASALVKQKIDEFPASLSSSKARAEVLLAFAADGKGELGALKIAAGALAYLTSPMDLIPDHDPDGYTDDAAVVDLATKKIAAELKAYCARTGHAAAALD